MNVTVKIPSPLRAFTKGQADVATEGGTLGEVLENLERNYAGIRAMVIEPDGRIKPFVNIYVNADDARHLGELAARLSPGDEISIIPAIAGGRP